MNLHVFQDGQISTKIRIRYWDSAYSPILWQDISHDPAYLPHWHYSPYQVEDSKNDAKAALCVVKHWINIRFGDRLPNYSIPQETTTMIDLNAVAKAIHNAKLRAAFNLTILDIIHAGKITESAVIDALPFNAMKFFSAWSPTDTAMYARSCLDLAFVELAEREGITDPDLADFFRFGFTGNLDAMDHAIDYAEDSAAGNAAFEAGKRVADAYRNASS